MNIHESVTLDRVQDAMLNDDSTGICISCGNEAGGHEPDARKRRCDACGEFTVYGAEQLLVEGLLSADE